MSHLRFLALAAAAASLSVCSDNGPQNDVSFTETQPDTGVQVSDPLRSVEGPGLRLLASEAEDDIVYVALSGSATAAVQARVRRFGDEQSVAVQLVDGGFEPVAIRAAPTDSIEVVLLSATNVVLSSSIKPVRRTRPPTVVRTWPPRRKSDVPVNASIVVVFSEPVERSSVVNGIRLFDGQRQVGGLVQVLDGDGTSVAFTPSARLTPDREYRVVVTRELRDLDGEAADSAVIGFITGSRELGPPARIEVRPDTVEMMQGESYQLDARVFDVHDNVLVTTITWTSLAPALNVTSTGLVTAPEGAVSVRDGSVRASAEGITGEAYFIVSPAPTSIEMVPAMVVVGSGDSVAVDVVARNASGTRIFPPLITSSSQPSVASMDVQLEDFQAMQPTRWIRARDAGAATVTARSGRVRSSVQVIVSDIRDVAFVRVAPAMLELLPQETRLLRAYLHDANGDAIQGSRAVAWASSNPSVLGVDNEGRVTANGIGTATITAAAAGPNGPVPSSATIAVTPDAAAPRFAEVSAGYYSVCAVTVAHDAYCWGQLPGEGIFGTMTPRPSLVEGGRDFATVSAGAHTHCGLSTTNVAYCWPAPHDAAVPVDRNLAFTTVATVSNFGCGIVPTGSAYCWGTNLTGQLGDGTTTARSTAAPVSGGLTFRMLDVAGDYDYNGPVGTACGVTTEGDAYCWGENWNGVLGTGELEPNYSTVPVRVAGGLKFTQVAVGGVRLSHACGIVESGEAYCWGSNDYGQLGDGTQKDRTAPTAVAGGIRFTAISAAVEHTCGIAVGGAAYCWGYNSRGQLGVSQSTEMCSLVTHCRRAPVAVQTPLRFKRIVARTQFTCGIATTDRLYCWGHPVGIESMSVAGFRSEPTLVQRP